MSVEEEIRDILTRYRKIAVVGLSDQPGRPSYNVTKYMIEHGYEITGVRPDKTEILGRPCLPKLADVPSQLEIVDVFRAPEYIPALVDELIPLKPKVLWLQLGIRHLEAEKKARAAGIRVVSDRCILIEHGRI